MSKEMAEKLQAAYAKGWNEAVERCAETSEKQWPPRSAHNYSSENADRYRALEDASEWIAKQIRTLKKETPK